jgi:hypothetical protein
MESVTYEGDYPYMHNHLINHSECILGIKKKKIMVYLFESWSRGKKRKEEIGMKNQLSYLTTVEAYNNFNDVFKGGHHDSCVT